MATEIQSAGKVVVGTDCSNRADKAIEWAAKTASSRGYPLLVVSVLPEVPLPKRTRAASALREGTDYVNQLREQVGKKLADIADRVRGYHPTLVVETALVQGSAPLVLAQASKDAVMVVVGARGQTAPPAVRILGGTADQVTSHAHGPVAVITDLSEEDHGGPVVVGVDGSDESKVAIGIAFREAASRHVPVRAINTWDFGPYDAFNAEIWAASIDEMAEDLTSMVNDLVKDEAAKHPEVAVQVDVVRGRPEFVLVDASKKASLVVVGSRGRGGFAGLLLGSTSKHVLREARCPVIVART
ncbi:universal stress protein [Brooklawnia cerclae]|uniref:Nucleotide-binding universal stress UspA family protein n=1 Tax=Brooklawnia cerclae TaxID=349934 RepID=A0ABX0SK06_9ACTN|nr:universal stress protein [Brooklawnia cerclae]NIH58259.1 nucleotide-binding universal stress UspA family protein [Brooklawnia cerclae]